MQIESLADIAVDLKRHHVDIVAIGNGNKYFATQFRRSYNTMEYELYVDEKLESYKSFLLPRSTAATLLPSVHWISMLRKLVSDPKVAPGKVQGDAIQQGGLFVIGPGDVIWFRHVNKATGDHADVQEVLKIATKQ